MLHYHGTPITPRDQLMKMAGRCFCVSYGETHEGRETYTRHEGLPPPLCEYETLYTAPTAQPLQAEPVAREVKNQVCIRGLQESALRSILASQTSPDGIDACLTAFAHEVVDLALELAASPPPRLEGESAVRLSPAEEQTLQRALWKSTRLIEGEPAAPSAPTERWFNEVRRRMHWGREEALKPVIVNWPEALAFAMAAVAARDAMWRAAPTHKQEGEAP